MPQAKFIDPVIRQADALRRLWGDGAGKIAQRYLAEAQRRKRTAQIEFWTEVVSAVAPPTVQSVKSAGAL